VRALWLIVLAASTAYAQAPGDVPPQPAQRSQQRPAAPAAAPAPSAPGVMDDRWAVAFALASEGFTPKVSGSSNVQFAGIELSGRFRITPAIEVAASLLAGGSKGDLSTGGVFADFRYRFFPESAWNLYVLAGLGAVSAGSKNGSDAEKRGRGALRLGVGGERRFGHLAVYAELCAIGVGENKDVGAQTTQQLVDYELERYALSGGALVVGGTYYF